MEVGRLLEKREADRINIISEDKGYEAVVEYAAKINPSLIIDQQPFLSEARRMEERGFTAEEIKNRQGPLKLGQTFVDFDRNRQFDREMRKQVPDVTEEEIETLKGIFMEPGSRKEHYLKTLKILGKERGLLLYRGEKRGKLSERYL